MDYTFKFNQTPYNSVIDMIRWSKERQDARNKERNDNYGKLMQMLGRGVAAYKMNKDMNDWKADQAYWNDEYGQLEDMENLPYTPVDNMTFMDYADDDAWLNSRINLAKLGL